MLTKDGLPGTLTHVSRSPLLSIPTFFVQDVDSIETLVALMRVNLCLFANQ